MSKSELGPPGETQAPTGWRIKVGFAMLIISLAGIPLVVGLLALVGVSGSRLAAISGGLMVSAELMMIAGAAIAGKEGFAYIKATVFGYLKKYGPPQKVGKARYTIGLLMFIVPLLFGWALPYFGKYIPGYTANTVTYSVIGDVMLGVSLFLLGGEFWDKLRSLFLHDASAIIPEKQSAHSS